MAGYKWLEIPDIYANIVKDKKKSANSYYRYFLARLSRMFEYKNLPDTIPHEMLDRYLMNNGIACITKVNGKLYCFYGNLGGPQDVYYRPTEFIISNPHIKTESGELFTANVPINPSYDPCCDVTTDEPSKQQGVLIRNDTEWIGLAPMLSRYSYLLAENVLTLRTADVMLRITALITAPSDKEKASADEYIKALEKGDLKVIGESPFFDGIKLQSPPSNNGSYLTQFIEYQQYLKGSIFNELGLVANYNMKREAIGKGESTLDQDAIIPLADNMLLCRQEDMKRVNELYGTDISVSFSSAWLENLIETKSALITVATSQQGMGGGSFDGADGSDAPEMPQNAPESPIKEDNEDEVKDVSVGEEVDKSDSSSEDGDQTEGSDESAINDTASEGFLEELNEQLDEKLENPEEMVVTTQQEGEDNVEESTDDKEDVSDN